MRKLLILFLVICTMTVSQITFGQQSDKIIYGEKHKIHSEIIGEDKEYWVHLPMNYNKNNEKYPVLFITDGDEHFFLASGITQFMSSQYLIPEFIVVAIFHKDRNHDLTPTHCLLDWNGSESDAAKVSGGGERLLQFIEKELIVKIENDYRTAPYRLLAGHSLGGLFSVYAYLNRSTLFNSFISMDPALTWDEKLCERTLRALPGHSPNFKNKLYISSAHNAPKDKKDKSPFRISQDMFFKELNGKQKGNAKHDYFEDENHLTVPYRSLYSGLSFIFSDYYILTNPKFVEEVSFFESHYKQISSIYGMDFKPEEGLVEMLGNYFLRDMNNYSKAAEFFKLNTVNYPGSDKAFENLAKAYQASGNTKDAILNFQKVLEINPENKEAEKFLRDSNKK